MLNFKEYNIQELRTLISDQKEELEDFKFSYNLLDAELYDCEEERYELNSKDNKDDDDDEDLFNLEHRISHLEKILEGMDERQWNREDYILELETEYNLRIESGKSCYTYEELEAAGQLRLY